MAVLPDIGMPGVTLVICGEQAGPVSARVGHYYAASSNRFWQTLLEVGLVPAGINWRQDFSLPEYGIGLTDIKKTTVHGDRAPVSDTDRDRLFQLMAEWRPEIIAFHGLSVARSVLNTANLACGAIDGALLPPALSARAVFAVTSTSAANGHFVRQRQSWEALAKEFRRRRGAAREN